MTLYVVTNVCHTDSYKRADTSNQVISIHENKIDALIKAINYNFEQWGFFIETNGDVGDYYANDFMEIVDNEYHDISYEYSSDDFFWKVFDENIENFNFAEDKLQLIYDVTITCLTNPTYAEFTMAASYDLYQVDEVETVDT
jgi:hypothetical protein